MTLGWLAVSLVALGAGGGARFETGLSPEVKVETLGGQVDVTAQATGEIQVQSRMRKQSATAWHVESRQTGDEVVVRLCCGRCEAPSARCGKDAAADLELTVPEQSDVSVTATSAQVSVVGVKGPLRVETVTGGVSAEGSASQLRLSTVGGDIAAAPEQIAQTHLTTDSGNVQLKLPADQGAQLRFSTVSGTFNGHPISVQTHAQPVGEGGPPIEVQTVTGALRVDQPAGAAR